MGGETGELLGAYGLADAVNAKPLFGDGQAELRCTDAIHGEAAVHLRYEVR